MTNNAVSSSEPLVRVRIAPSPTGNLHVGTARTALFNYLFAKRHAGKFILRIEDTDLERSESKYTQNIFDSLKALGLQWDEGPDVGGPYAPYVQSERTARYREVAEQLLQSGAAYWSYATEEELDALRQQANADKQPFVYREDPATAEQIAVWKADPECEPSLRLRIPRQQRKLVVNDQVRGSIEFDTELIGDFVLLKSNGTPAYNFACVVDDGDMAITHVIRGEDHISNTPKQLLIYEALGWKVPEFAHLSMILAPDRSKLSKRHGATAVSDFIYQEGFLPEAFVNFMALLGWSSPSGEEILALEQLSQQFALERVSHSGAVFDRDKLCWMNAQYIRGLAPDELLNRAKPFLQTYLQQPHPYSDKQLTEILELVKEPITQLAQLPEAVSYFFGEAAPSIDPELEQTVLQTPEGQQVLGYVAEQLQVPEVLEAFQQNNTELIAALLKAWANALKPLKTKTVMWSLRAAVTGRVQGADLPSTLSLLGLTRVQQRITAAIKQTQPVQ